MRGPVQPMPSESGGLLASARRLAATAVGLLRTRLELLVTELEEERVRLVELLFWAAGAIFFLATGIVLLVIFVVALFWDTHRLLVLGVLTACFFTAGAGLVAGLRRRLRNRPRMLAATLDELAKDRDQLTPP